MPLVPFRSAQRRRLSEWSRGVAAALAAALAASTLAAYAQPPAAVGLQPDQWATLHVNQLAVIDLPKTPPTSISGGAGESLVLVRRRNRRNRTVFLYRAVQAGNQVFIVTSDHLPDGHCISCVTEHYFVTVVP
jgi:hypothetical protein